MKVLASCFVPVFIMLMLAARAHAAGPQSSADYHFSVESLDGGGLRTASADYAADGSFDTGNFITSADYAQRGGYIAMMHLSARPSKGQTLYVVADPVDWSEVIG